MSSDLDFLTGPLGSVVLSKDRRHRYRLTRRWGDGGLMVGLGMLNPSRADHKTGDLTVTKSVGFASRLGGTSLVVVNVFAYRTPDPDTLLGMEDPVGPANERFLREVAQEVDLFIVAWGGMPKRLLEKAAPSIAVLREMRPRLDCLGKTRSGAPRHPSRLGYEKGLRSFCVWP